MLIKIVDLEEEISIIKVFKSRSSQWIYWFYNNDFHQTKEAFHIPSLLFEDRKEISFRGPFSKRNEKIKRIISKLEEYTNYKIKFRHSWKTRKLRSLFPLKYLYSRIEGCLQRNIYIQRILYWRNKT